MRATYSLVFALALLIIPAATAFSLDEYPSVLAVNGWNVQVNFVVGHDAPTTDVLVGVDLAASITEWVGTENQVRPYNNQLEFNARRISKTDEDEYAETNYVAIGRPCDNAAVAELLDTTACDAFSEGEGYLEIFERENGAAVVVSGGDDAGIRAAKDVLLRIDEYDLDESAYRVLHGELYPLKYTAEAEIEAREEGEVADEIPETEEEPCDGCRASDECLTTGMIRDGQYCSVEHELKEQLADGATCGTHYQCITGTCEKNVCGTLQEDSGEGETERKGFFVAIIDFFKRLFGKA